MPWRLREYHAGDDLDDLIRVWGDSSDTGARPVHSLAEILDACLTGLAVVGLVEERVAGVVVARLHGDRAGVLFLGLDRAWRGRGLGSALLAELERRLVDQGVYHISALLPPGETGHAAFRNSSFEIRDLNYFERLVPLQPQEAQHLTAVGGRMLPRGLWEQVAGMHAEKELIERRLVLPLSKPELAQEFGVVPPQAAVLFGPPGTGKTTFAKAIASRLGWPFIEISPSKLDHEGKGLAGALAATFQEITPLEHAVVFIDEVEEIASRRGSSGTLQRVTNEMLKIIPRFRESPGRLLVCATNFVRALDPAFLRHGRFDYVLPIGPPDEVARAAIWERYVPEHAIPSIDLERLVAASAMFTPADIQYAARKASQRALEEAVFGEAAGPESSGPGTGDYLWALEETRPTVSAEMLAEFKADLDTFGRF